MSKDQDNKTASISEGPAEQQRLGGGNYPWDTPSELEKQTEKETEKMDSRATTAVNEILSKIERGPIHLESQRPHPYFKPTLSTLYAKRANQVVIEADVIIPHHLVDNISEEVVKSLKSTTHKLETPINVVYEEQDRTGTIKTTKSGIVEEYRFVEVAPNSGSISATIEGVIKWTEK